MYKNFIGLFLLGGLVLSSCSEPSNGITPSGMTYNIIRKGDSDIKLDSGMVVTVNLQQTLVDVNGDTLMTRGTDMPVPVNMTGKADPMMEALAKMSKGDSATMSCPSEKFFPTLPPSVPADSKVCYEVGIVEVFTTAEAYQAYVEEQEVARNLQEDVLLKQYLADSSLTAQKTETGLYYVVTEEGSGEPAAAGDFIEVHYTGTLLDGTMFDSSVKRGETFVFQVGQGRVIRGWDEGFQLLKEGSKGVLVIPSSLGYGARGAGQTIGPNASLRFDVEFVKNHKEKNPKQPVEPNKTGK